MMQELLQEMSVQIAGQLGYILIAIVGAFIMKAINNYVKNETMQNRLKNIVDVGYNAVVEVNNSFVDDLKKKDTFTKKDGEIALQKAKNTVIEQLSPVLLETLQDSYSDVDMYLEGLIESQVEEVKRQRDNFVK